MFEEDPGVTMRRRRNHIRWFTGLLLTVLIGRAVFAIHGVSYAPPPPPPVCPMLRAELLQRVAPGAGTPKDEAGVTRNGFAATACDATNLYVSVVSVGWSEDETAHEILGEFERVVLGRVENVRLGDRARLLGTGVLEISYKSYLVWVESRDAAAEASWRRQALLAVGQEVVSQL